MSPDHPSNWKYFLGLSIPEPENTFLTEIKQHFHPQKHLSSPPHVTLIPPFLMPNRRYMLEKLAKIARYHEPFKLIFDQIGSFKQPKHGTVFLEPKKSESIKHLVNELGDEIPLLPRERNFHPHLTLAQRVPHEALDEVKSELRALNIKLKLLVESLTLFQQDEAGQWQLEQEFVFGTDTRHRSQTWSRDDDQP